MRTPKLALCDSSQGVYNSTVLRDRRRCFVVRHLRVIACGIVGDVAVGCDYSLSGIESEDLSPLVPKTMKMAHVRATSYCACTTRCEAGIITGQFVSVVSLNVVAGIRIGTHYKEALECVSLDGLESRSWCSVFVP